MCYCNKNNACTAEISLLPLKQWSQEYLEIFLLQRSHANPDCLLILSMLVSIFVAQQQEDDPRIFNPDHKPTSGLNFLTREKAVYLQNRR